MVSRFRGRLANGFAKCAALSEEHLAAIGKFRNACGVILLPLAWSGLEYVRGILFSGLPWNPLGVSQHANLAVIQIADANGVERQTETAPIVPNDRLAQAPEVLIEEENQGHCQLRATSARLAVWPACANAIRRYWAPGVLGAVESVRRPSVPHRHPRRFDYPGSRQ